MKSTFKNSVLVRSLAALGLAIVATAATAAAPFPSKPVRIVVNTAPGGLTDAIARLVTQKMSEKLGKSVFVDNRAGGGGLLGIQIVKSAPPDGHTLLATAGTISILPAVKQDPGYDLLKDFTGVGPMVRSALMMVVAPSQPDKTLADFVARAKANPNQMTYASAGVGTTTHIGAAIFMRQAGLKLLHVPYKGNAAGMPDVMAGRVDVIFESYGSGNSKLRAGHLRALGVSSSKRLSSLPEVPTIAEQGYPNYGYYLWVGLLAPAGTPKDVVQKLSDALRSALTSKEMTERIRQDGAEAMLMTPNDYNAFLKRDVEAMSKLVSELGVPKQ